MSVVIVSSRNHGATWTRHVIARLDRKLSRATPVVAASGRHVVVAWRASAGKQVVRARISHDSGRTWGPTTTLGAGTGGISAAALGSRVAVASGRLGDGAWVRVHKSGSWKKKRFVPVGKATTRKRPVVALHGTTQVGVLVGRYPGGVPAPILRWHESPDNGATWAPAVTIGDEEEGQVEWSSTGALTIAFGSTDFYFLRTRS